MRTTDLKYKVIEEKQGQISGPCDLQGLELDLTENTQGEPSLPVPPLSLDILLISSF